MTFDEVMHVMDTGTLADRRELARQVASLTRELAEANQKSADRQHHVESITAERDQLRDEYRVELELLARLLRESDEASTRDRNRFVLVGRAAVPFFADWLGAYEHFEDAALTVEARQLRQTAREMLALLDGENL